MQQVNQVNNFGLFLIGRYCGIIDHTRQGNDGQPWVQHFAGIEVPKTNGFPGETETVRLNVPRDLVNQGIVNRLQNLIGKNVRCDVWVRSFASRNGAGHNLNLSNYLDAVTPLSDADSKKAAA